MEKLKDLLGRHLMYGILIPAILVSCTQPETEMADDAAVTTVEPQQTETSLDLGDNGRLATRTDAELGTYLTDAQGRSLYLFMADSSMTSTCYDACAEAWPPYLSDGMPAAGEGVNASLISTMQRRDGKMQVTYNGWPLYYFVKDQGPGQTSGQDVMGFGAEWYLLTPQGEKLEHEE